MVTFFIDIRLRRFFCALCCFALICFDDFDVHLWMMDVAHISASPTNRCGISRAVQGRWRSDKEVLPKAG